MYKTRTNPCSKESLPSNTSTMSSARWIAPLFLAVLLVLTLSSGAVAQGPVAAPASFGPAASGPALPPLDCTSALMNLSACLTYVEQGSNLTAPVKGCCPSLSSLVDNQPVCLCQLLSGTNSFGIKIDTTKALMLPTACRVVTPPVSLCAEMGIPVASPSELSPAPSSGGPEQPGANPSTGTPATAPSNSKAGSSSSRAQSVAFLVSLSIVAFF